MLWLRRSVPASIPIRFFPASIALSSLSRSTRMNTAKGWVSFSGTAESTLQRRHGDLRIAVLGWHPREQRFHPDRADDYNRALATFQGNVDAAAEAERQAPRDDRVSWPRATLSRRVR